MIYIAATTDGNVREHVRLPPKRIWWQTPDGRRGLDGVRLAELLPWASDRLAAVGLETPVVVTEGEPAAEALIHAGIPAIGTFGANAIPTAETLRAIAPGRIFVTWPDEDQAGWIHMEKVEQNLYAAGAAVVRRLIYRPVTAPSWPEKHDAKDFVAGIADRQVARFATSWLVEDWSRRIPRRSQKVHEETRKNRFLRVDSERFENESVAAALRDRYGIAAARPGRTVRCPRHDDRHASLSILADDRRAICWSATCLWSGSGVTAAEIGGAR